MVYPWPSEFAIPEKFDVSTKEPSAEEECMPTRRSVRSTSTPSSFTYTSPGRSAKKGSTNSNNLTNEWQWLCESCLSTNSKEIIGSEVKVWWHDDACAYSGVVNAFDPESDCYRVLYEDNEWEFIQFTQEVYLIKPNV